MGTWGAGNFSNDAAADFVQSLDNINDVYSAIREERVLPLDADISCEVLAASDLIAAMMSRPAEDMPGNALDILGDYDFPDDKLLKDTRHAVEQVRDQSELAELWAEGDFQEWKEVIADLLHRLDPQNPYVARISEEEALGPIYGHCCICEKGIEENEIVDLVHEIDDGIVYSTMTLHAHHACIEEKFKPPHWNEDGSPSAGVLKQFADSMGL